MQETLNKCKTICKKYARNMQKIEVEKICKISKRICAICQKYAKQYMQKYAECLTNMQCKICQKKAIICEKYAIYHQCSSSLYKTRHQCAEHARRTVLRACLVICRFFQVAWPLISSVGAWLYQSPISPRAELTVTQFTASQARLRVQTAAPGAGRPGPGALL